jgi:hypothetical protein
VVFSTHSPEFLDAFGDRAPTTTVFRRKDGETVLGVLSGDELAEWLKKYRLGELHASGELDIMLDDILEGNEEHPEGARGGE